jgi:hypothetical protein
MGPNTRSVGLVALVLLAPLVGVAAAAGGHAGTAPPAAPTHSGPNPCVGTTADPPETPTVVSIQGARAGEKTDAMVVSVRPSGAVLGVHNVGDHRWWAYDVDRLSNGNFLLATTRNRHTNIVELDAETGDHVTDQDFEGVHDTHDVDLVNGDELLMNDMGDERNRVLVYNLTREEVVWEYRFDEHTDRFPTSGGGPYGEDWTHNNDVEQVREGVIMVSVRNYDQVVAINRSTKETEWTLGEDDNAAVLDEQHNPDFITTEDGRATVLVADSLNDRVVEYTREGDEWNRTWVLRGGGLAEPRDADRLPDGNTLVVDRRGHRTVEITPEGEVVWEVYTPWQPYDAERLGTPDESSGPAMTDTDAAGVREMTGHATFTDREIQRCYEFLSNVTENRLVPEGGISTAATDADATIGSDTDRASPTVAASPAGTGSVLGEDDEGGGLPVAPVAGAAVVVIALGGAAVWYRSTGA